MTAHGTASSLAVVDLSTFPGNPRKGRVEVIAESLTANGQYRPIVVNKGTLTGRPLEVLAGNHTLLAARELGWETIEAWLIDVDEETAKRIVATDNRTADLGEYDNELLLELLSSLDSLDGTGYTTDELTALAKSQEDPTPPEDFPSFDDDIATEYCCPKCGYEWSGKQA